MHLLTRLVVQLQGSKEGAGGAGSRWYASWAPCARKGYSGYELVSGTTGMTAHKR